MENFVFQNEKEKFKQFLHWNFFAEWKKFAAKIENIFFIGQWRCKI